MPNLIRMATPDDAATVCAIYAPYVIKTVISFETEVPTEEEMRKRISSISTKFPFLVFEEKGNVIGYAYASPHRERGAYRFSVDVSVYVAPEHHRKGVGRQLYTRLLEILTKQGFYNAFAGISLPNPGSIGIHESFGFKPIAVYKQVGYKNGKWHDVGWWQLVLREGREDPEEPICVNGVEETL